MRSGFPNVFIVLALAATGVQAQVSQEEAERLGRDLTPLGAEREGNADGAYPEWTGGIKFDAPPSGEERRPEHFPPFDQDNPNVVITAENMDQHRDKLTEGHIALLEKFPDSYKIPVYESQRSGYAPDFIYEATKRNAVNAQLENDGESLLNAITGIPFPIPQSGKEVIWNHKLRYRGQGVTRYNVQLAVQEDGEFTPFKMREDIRFHYNYPEQEPDDLKNVGIYFLQHVVAPARQAGQVLLVHETMDQVTEARRAWLYNPGLRRVRRAPNVAYDNPGTGADGLRTNDQLDVFNGATDRYTWKIAGKREMYLPYNAYRLADDQLKYDDIAQPGHIDQDLTRYELRRVWVLESELRDGTTHLYKRRTFYVDEDTWTILHADIYDRREQLWRVQENHTLMVPWLEGIGPAAGTVYDLQANRYLVMEMGNEEPLVEEEDFSLGHFTTMNMTRMADR
jgi:hypothetical protein